MGHLWALWGHQHELCLTPKTQTSQDDSEHKPQQQAEVKSILLTLFIEMSAVDLAAELKRLEEELERKKMEEKIQTLKAQLADDDEYVEESEYYEEEVEEEYEEEVYYEEEEYYEGDEYEEEEEYAQEEYYEEEESEPAIVPAPRSAAPVTRVAPPAPAPKQPSASSVAPFRQSAPVTRTAAPPSVRVTSSATPATSPPRQMKKIVKRKVNLTGKPKYINGTATAAEASAPASKVPTTVTAPASAPSPGASQKAAQPNAGVRRIFGFGKKPSTTDSSEVTPATVPVTSTSQVTAASNRGAASGPQMFKARTYAKDPASPAGQETPMEQILGPDLFAESRLIRRSVLACTKDRDLTLLYFASKWNRECKEFYPALKDFYCTIAAPQNLEVVYVSHDRSLSDFKEIFATMPWPAMPTGTSSFKNELAKNLKIIETPALAVLDTVSGWCITTHAMSDVAALERKNYEQAFDLVNTWRSIKPIPLDQVMMDVRLKHGKLERKPLYWQE